jgi:topoisomerase IA-like protein
MTVTLEDAVAMIAEKAGKGSSRRTVRGKASAPAKKKAGAGKPAAGKTAARRKA